MTTTDETRTPGALEAELERLLAVATFDPPAGFTRRGPIDADVAAATADPVAFWAEKARELLTWDKPFTKVLNDDNPPFYKWFEDGELNLSANCLDRHVDAGNGDRVAFHWAGEEGERLAVTYADLLAETQRLANGLRSLGVGRGDVVGIFLPMIPQVAASMLACARIGAVHNVVFGGFAATAVKERMEVSDAKVLITVDGARRKGRTAPVKSAVDAAMGELASLEHIIVVEAVGAAGLGGERAPMKAGRDVWYADLLAAADPVCPAEPMPAEAPLFILYSSGSTAKPKGILHTTGGYLLGATYTYRAVFDLDPATDVYWCSADVGWITGHSYIVYGPLANGATSVMYEGAPDYPDYDVWWKLIDEYKVTVFYTAPTAIRACIKWGAEYPDRHDLSSLRLLGTVGEPINPKAWLWYHKVIGGERCPIVDTWWQTETGAIMISPVPGVTSTKPGSATRPLPGFSPALVTEDGQPLSEGVGVLVVTKPWPSMLRTLYKDDERFVETYFSRFGPTTYLVGDAARLDADGYFWIIGRIDDVINVSGHRLSTAEVESAIVAHEAVAEAAVVAQADEQTGQAIVAFVTLAGGRIGDDATVAQLREHVAARIGKLARPKRIIWADDLPKTRSGKIMRRLLRDVAEGRALGDVTTLRDPAVMAALASKVAEAGPDDQ
ncbi:acetate--CoA ligase [Frankia sp. AgB1.9]|uniref:acetate--CoA ligase n=1 Tax=unclassified Frankia TaxID=2632575 RepID=UPI001933EC14|nr:MULTISPECIES: acetate--CoA ligase [unclassified Frankia]MBL7491203.1 acetate--CoA ligase [Frankia sp. AgW1.1]MBL7549940.1 acetate--CoA ligase [Frankia sp. AgB1.9]MBL7622479.1 acetate--CoA ligase [Frankia sp. AgB1.8]